MLKEIIISLAGLGIFSLIISYFVQSKGSRIMIQIISLLLFIMCTYGSMQSQTEYCFFDTGNITNTNCMINNTYDTQSVWSFTALILLTSSTILLTILSKAPETSIGKEDPDF